MKNLVNVLILVLFHFVNILAQTDSNTIYKNLQVQNYYKVNTSTFKQYGKWTAYKVNDKIVDKATYDKYHNSSSCCPCILRSYNENDILLSELVSCDECGVGEFKEFYPNGKIKVKGKYRENPTGDWSDIFKRGYCSVPTGTWLYYNDVNGTHYLHHIEIWDNGQFIEQRPESKKTEIWDVGLYVNTARIDTQSITISDFKNIRVIPKYKNKLRNTSLLKAQVWTASDGNKKECSIETLKDINIEEMGLKSKIKSTENIIMNIIIFDGDKYIKGFILKIRQ